MKYRKINMKKVLIIGYGDLGNRIANMLPERDFIGVSRSFTNHLSNVQSIQLDWNNEPFSELPSQDISSVVLILKPASSDIKGYKIGFLDAAHKIFNFLNNNFSYQQIIAVSSTRVYGLDNGRDITELTVPIPDDEQGRIIKEYEDFVTHSSKVDPLILRPSGLYDDKDHWMKKHVNSFNGKKYSLQFIEANTFNRNDLSLIISNYINDRQFANISGPLICSNIATTYKEIFSNLYPNLIFKDFFSIPDALGKTFNPQKLIDSGLMG